MDEFSPCFLLSSVNNRFLPSYPLRILLIRFPAFVNSGKPGILFYGHSVPDRDVGRAARASGRVGHHPLPEAEDRCPARLPGLPSPPGASARGTDRTALAAFRTRGSPSTRPPRKR